MDNDRHKALPQGLVIGAFICYLAIVFGLVFYKGWGGITFLRDNYSGFETWIESISYSLNLIPFRFLFNAGKYTVRAWIVNVCGNIALFIPMGIFVPVLFPKAKEWRWRQFILKGILLIAIIELVQLLLMCGEGDVDDIILNVSGMCVGFACTKLLNI